MYKCFLSQSKPQHRIFKLSYSSKAVHRISCKTADWFCNNKVNLSVKCILDHEVETITVLCACSGNALIGINLYKFPVVTLCYVSCIIVDLCFVACNCSSLSVDTQVYAATRRLDIDIVGIAVNMFLVAGMYFTDLVIAFFLLIALCLAASRISGVQDSDLERPFHCGWLSVHPS